MFEDKVIPLDVWVSQFVDWLVNNYRDFFQALKWPVETTLNALGHHRCCCADCLEVLRDQAGHFFDHRHDLRRTAWIMGRHHDHLCDGLVFGAFLRRRGNSAGHLCRSQ